MLHIYASEFIWIGSVLRHLMSEMHDGGELVFMPEEYMRSVASSLLSIADKCQTLELAVSEATVRHWEGQFKTSPVLRFIEGRSAMQEIERTINNELQDMPLYFFSRELDHEIRKMVKELDPLIGKPWPVAINNLVEAGDCYSHENFTASVFHSMRSMEKLLTTIAASLTGVDPSREQWQNLIERIESAIKELDKLPKSPDRDKKQMLYSEIAMQFRFIKNAWRNHVMHSRTDYSEKEAREIWWHVKRSIEKASDELPELLET